METAVELDLPVDHRSVREAREFVANIEGLAHDRLADAELVVSELVTNALLHARPRAARPIRLTLVRYDNRLRIDVQDPGTFTADCDTFAPSQPDSDSDSRGLRIVQILASHWRADNGRVTAWLNL